MSDDLPDGQLTLHEVLGTEPANRPMDWGRLAQDKAEQHLELCENGLMCSEGECPLEEHAMDEPGCAINSPACAPYCGCRTCQVRETLFAAWPYVEHAVRDGRMHP